MRNHPGRELAEKLGFELRGYNPTQMWAVYSIGDITLRAEVKAGKTFGTMFFVRGEGAGLNIISVRDFDFTEHDILAALAEIKALMAAGE